MKILVGKLDNTKETIIKLDLNNLTYDCLIYQQSNTALLYYFDHAIF